MLLHEVQRVDSDKIPAHIRRLYLHAILLTMVGNLALVALKALSARSSGSTALLADMFNSAGDVFYSLVMALGLLLALKPADECHPHGHRRYEALVGFLIGAGMSVAGISAVRAGIERLQTGPQPITSLYAYFTPLVVLLIKGGMYAYVRNIGQRANSPALLASARDNLSDVISSAVALVGMLLSRVFSAADPIGALLVSLWIFRGVYLVVKESTGYVTGRAGSPELAQKVLETALSVPGVRNVHRVILEHVGPEVRADLHINMDGDVHLTEVHNVSEAVCHAVEQIEGIEHAYVHVEPEDEPPAPDSSAA
ncbi:MAG: cation transporter [Chloroflexi bacterium]|nr:cation transporter [Chloroflexota bacterium]